MSRRRWLSVLVVFCLALGIPATAFAAGAEDTVKTKQTELTDQLKKGKRADEKKIGSVFDELLDYEALAKDSLGDHWDERSDAEKKEFRELLERLVRSAYRKNLKKTLGYNIEFKGTVDAKNGKLVRTVAKSKTNAREEPIGIDYLMHEVDGKWKVKDIVTEGASLVRNYRSQFTRVIKKQGFPELVKKMKKKAGKEKV